MKHVNLPWELVEEILYRVQQPLSIIRFKIVCKQWNTLFETRLFVNNLLLHAHPQFLLCNNSNMYSAIENEDDNGHLAYSLTNTLALFLLQKGLKTDGTASKNTTSLFKQQLAANVEKIFGMIWDNLKKQLSALLCLCIKAPRILKVGIQRSAGRSLGKDSPAAMHWQSIIDCLNSFLALLKDNHVPLVLIQKIYTQTFSFINMQLFNSLMLRRECCTFSNGKYVKSGLAELELWCGQVNECAGASWEQLKHIRQAVGFLVIPQKHTISFDDIVHDLCPILSFQQLYWICIAYSDDCYNTGSVSQEVISSIRRALNLMTDQDNHAESNSYLLDDNSSTHFSINEISTSMHEKDFATVKTAKELLDNPSTSSARS